MFKFLNNTKTIKRQKEEICKLKEELGIKNTLIKIYKEREEKLQEEKNVSEAKLFNVKHILNTTQNEFTAYREIKNVIYD